VPLGGKFRSGVDYVKVLVSDLTFRSLFLQT
jgi:hypothetical protein